MEQEQNLLEYRQVDIHYGEKRVVQDFSLQMKPEKFLALSENPAVVKVR